MEGLRNNPQLMQQMLGAGGQPGMLLQNPQMLAQMMQNPLVQQTMEAMMNNPQLMERMMASNPMFAGNPELVSQHRAMYRYCIHLLFHIQARATAQSVSLRVPT